MKYRENPNQFVSIAGMFIVVLVLAAQPVMAQFDDISLVGISLYGEGIPETSDSSEGVSKGFLCSG